MKVNHDDIVKGVELIIRGLNADLNEEPYKGTPDRVARFYEELYSDRPADQIKTFPEDFDGPITLTNHVCWSLCPHHLLPVRFTVDVSYTPRQDSRTEAGKYYVLGLSKLPRIVDRVIAEGPALQELVTKRIVDRLSIYADVVKCQIGGEHLCTMMRGVKTSGRMVTSASYNRNAVKMEE